MNLHKITLLIGLSLISFNIFAASISGKVIGIMDGDTIKILDNTNTQYKVRLAGIDSPEKKQAFGNVSKKSLSDILFGQSVVVEYKKYDRYGRIVGKVLINGKDANLEQIELGHAWFYKEYQNELVLDDRLSYLHAHESAEKNKIGLWIDKNPIPPWEFRKLKSSNNSPTVSYEEKLGTSKSPELINTHKPIVVQPGKANKSSECMLKQSDAEILECLEN